MAADSRQVFFGGLRQAVPAATSSGIILWIVSVASLRGAAESKSQRYF